MAVHSVFDFSLHLPGCALAFFIILGASVMRTPREERHSAGGKAALAGWVLFLIVALGIAATLAPMAWKTLQGQRLGRIPEATLLSMSVQELDAAGERLFAVDPGADPLIMRFGDALRVKAAEAAVAIDTAAPEDLPSLYRAREEAGRLALKYYQRAYRAAPLEDTLLVKQAMTLDVLQRYAEAYLAYVKAVQLQPDNRYFRFNFGMHLVETGQYAAAVEQLQHAVNLPVDEREGPKLRNSARAALEYIRSRLATP
jgi:Flp pilus assembly protein TadD